MSNLDQDIARLQIEIEQQENVLAELEAEVLDLRRELNAFQSRYNRIVGAIEARLEAARTAIADLERQRLWKHGHPLGDYRPMEDFWEPPPDYVPVEEQFRRTWKVPLEQEAAGESGPPTKPRTDAINPDEADIKKLYRSLARRYHPDMTTDPAEREARNDLMARINDAYARRDLTALQTLASHPDAAPGQPLAALRLGELRQIKSQLERRIQTLRLERADIQLSDMMRLALEDKLTRNRGRDLLREIARQLERDYDAAMIRLEQLRREV